MSKIDIVIPAFNAAPYLSGAIESVIAQTESEWHIVVVDDGSTDDTRDVAQSYFGRLGSRMTYIHQANSGPAAARNAGIRATNSPLIAFLDADDLWPSDRLRHTFRAFENEPEIGLTYGCISRFRVPGQIVDIFRGNTGKAEGKVAREIYTRRIELPCCSVTLRRDCLRSTGLFDETLLATEDRDLWLRVAQRFPVRFIPQVLASYRMTDGSQSNDLPRLFESQRRFIDKHYGEADCGWSQRRAAFARVHKQQAESYADRKQFSAALLHVVQAVALAPWSVGNLRAALSILLRSLQHKSVRLDATPPLDPV